MLTSITTTKQVYIGNMHKMFAHYGFSQCPLTEERLQWLYDCNVIEAVAYRIGCDVAAGVSWIKAVQENMRG